MICPHCRTENLPGATRCAACTSWMVSPPPVREWTRARQGKVVGGVCRGLANRFGLPVAALRLAFVLSVFLGFAGVVAYVALWIAMPLEPASTLPAPGTRPPATSAQAAEARPGL